MNNNLNIQLNAAQRSPSSCRPRYVFIEDEKKGLIELAGKLVPISIRAQNTLRDYNQQEFERLAEDITPNNLRLGVSSSKTEAIESSNILKQEHEIENFKIFPNPFDEQITIKMPFPINQITLCDLSGRLHIFQKNINTNHFVINTSTLEKGAYLLEVIDVYNNPTRKRIVKH